MKFCSINSDKIITIILIIAVYTLAVPKTTESDSEINGSKTDANLINTNKYLNNIQSNSIDSSEIKKLIKRIEELQKECEILSKIVSGIDTVKRVPVSFECFNEDDDYYVNSPNAIEYGDYKLPCTLNISPGLVTIFVSGNESFKEDITIPIEGGNAKIGWKHYKLFSAGVFTMLFSFVELGFGLGWGLGDKDWKEASLYGFIPGATILTTSFVMMGIAMKSSETIEFSKGNKTNAINNSIFRGVYLSISKNRNIIGINLFF